MTVEPCEAWTNRLRAIQVAGVGTLALLTLSSGLGCGQTILRRPAGKTPVHAEAIPTTVDASNVVVPSNRWAEERRRGVGGEAPTTPIDASALEVAAGPQLKAGTWNGWRMPMANSAATRAIATSEPVEPNSLAPDAAKSAAVASNIPMPRRGAAASRSRTSLPQASNLGAAAPIADKASMTDASTAAMETSAEPAKTTSIPMPVSRAAQGESGTESAKTTSIPMPSPRVTASERDVDNTVLAASKESKIVPPLRHFSAEPGTAAAVSEAVDEPVTATTTESAPTEAATVGETPVSMPAMVAEPAGQADVAEIIPDATEADASVAADASVPAAAEAIASEVADPAPSFEPQVVSAADAPAEVPAAAAPAQETAGEPTQPASPGDGEPTAVSATAPPEQAEMTNPLEASELPPITLPDFDNSPLEVLGSTMPKAAVGDVAVESPKMSLDAAAAKMESDASLAPKAPAKAPETTTIPMPVKRAVRPKAMPKAAAVPVVKDEAGPVPDFTPVDDAAPTEKADAPPAIPTRIE